MTMTIDEIAKELDARGVKYAEYFPDSVTIGIEVGEKHWRFMPLSAVESQFIPSSRSNLGVPSYNGTPTHYANGKFKFVNHGRDDFGAQSCIPDMACKELRQEWPGYVVERDGSGTITREGPAPFKTNEEMKSYLKLAGMEIGGYDAKPPDKHRPFLDNLSTVDDVPEGFGAV